MWTVVFVSERYQGLAVLLAFTGDSGDPRQVWLWWDPMYLDRARSSVTLQ